MRRSVPSSLHSARTARTYPVEAEKLASTIQEAVKELPRWTLVRSSEAEIRAACRSRFFGFEDDVMVQLTTQTFGVRAVFESASRVGVWDLGQNGRNLKKLLAAIDRRLAS